MLKRKEFKRVTPESVGIDSRDIEWLIDRLESGFTEPHGLMIMRHGQICAEGWWSPYAPGIRHGLQSHSKTYAATAVGIAYTEGLLSLDERIIDIFPEEAPENPSENLKKLTVHDVLCMGCGMDEMPEATGHWIRDFLHTPVNHEPGTTYMYNSVGSSLLSAIVIRKTGMGMHEYLKPRLYDRIGIFSDNHVWMKMPDGCEVGGGGLFATTEDNLRLMKLYADGGVWEGERILAADYVERATTLQNESASEEAKNPPAKDNFVGYGYQIWMCRPKGVYRADGAMGQFTIVVPDKDMIIAITENASGAHWAQTTLDVMWEFLDRIDANPAADPGDENPEAAHLKNRMGRLALPNPAFAPYSPLAQRIQGRTWKITDGALYLGDVGIAQHMAGLGLPAPVESLSLAFRSDSFILSWKAGEEEGQAVVALDGSRKQNTLPGGITTQALMSGAWTGENVLEVKIRFIETCKENTLTFTFEGEELFIRENSTMAFGGPADQIITAEMDQYDRILDRQFVMNDAGKIDQIRDLYVTYNPQVDLQALKDGGFLDAVEEMMEPILDKFDDFSPEVLDYWAKRGMVKEAHGRDVVMNWAEYERKTGYHWEDPHNVMEGVQNQYKMWNSFVPGSAFDPANRDRRYPVVVVLHGGFNPISIIDGWGFVQEAAKREWIVIVPSLEMDDIIDEILEEAKKLYPVDESRIYATGFSYGGYMSCTLGNLRPDVYAAVGPCGAPISNSYCDREVGPEPQKPFDGVPRAIGMDTYMPIFTASGNLDGGRFPVYDAKNFKTGEPFVKEFVEGINSWAKVNHAREISVEEVLAMKGKEGLSEEEKHLGLPLPADCLRTVKADGITNYIGDLKSEDGIVRVRIMCEMNMPHWPTPEMIRQMYAFFEHFSRDPKTKESIYNA